MQNQQMNVTEIVRQLRDERSRLDAAIQALEGIGGSSVPIERRGRPPGATNKPAAGGPKKRRGMSAAAANVSLKQCGNVGPPRRSPGKRGFKAVNIRTGPRKDLLQADFGRPVLSCELFVESSCATQR